MTGDSRSGGRRPRDGRAPGFSPDGTLIAFLRDSRALTADCRHRSCRRTERTCDGHADAARDKRVGRTGHPTARHLAVIESDAGGRKRPALPRCDSMAASNGSAGAPAWTCGIDRRVPSARWQGDPVPRAPSTRMLGPVRDGRGRDEHPAARPADGRPTMDLHLQLPRTRPTAAGSSTRATHRHAARPMRAAASSGSMNADGTDAHGSRA